MIIPHKQRDTSVLYETLLALDQLPKEVCLNFIIMACWQIWMHRNGEIFRHIDPNTMTWKILLKKDLVLLHHKIKLKNKQAYIDWIEAGF